MAQLVVTPNNLGNTLKPNAITPNKYDINLDNSTIVASASGVLSLNVSGASAALISADTGNDLVLGADSKLFVDVPIKGVQVDGVTILPNAAGIVNLTDNDVSSIVDSSTIDLTLVGTQLTAVVKVSAVAGNLVTSQPDGLAVTASSIRALLDVDVQDAFGVHLYYASSTNV